MIDINDYTDEKGRFDGRYLLIRPLSTDGATADVWLSLDLNTVAMTDGDKIDQIARMSDDEIEKLGLMVAIKIYRPQNALDIEGEQRFRDEYMKPDPPDQLLDLQGHTLSGLTILQAWLVRVADRQQVQ